MAAWDDLRLSRAAAGVGWACAGWIGCS